MSRVQLTIPTPDGECAATLHVPEDGPPRPGVIMYVDAPGVRETVRAMADRVAAMGWPTLLPDVYYRHAPYRPFDTATVFADPSERERMMAMVHGITPQQIDRDAGAFLDALAARPEVATGGAGVIGYCMGGRAALLVAGQHGERVAAAASIHGGRLAAEDDPDSPHLLADRVRATVYVAAAQDDRSCPPEQLARLGAAYTAAGVRHTIETYPAAHGFAVPDVPSHDPAATQRHWLAAQRLFTDALGG